jgi:hypothetical protein
MDAVVRCFLGDGGRRDHELYDFFSLDDELEMEVLFALRYVLIRYVEKSEEGPHTGRAEALSQRIFLPAKRVYMHVNVGRLLRKA